ncbi:uncharacterized protein LOC119078426 [Bradysia coprophila]|uniref:uncharacterized protein LOC119078426 n=1 Tax=Bradysia coprophila TaxID=38358 RepID=UPI00187D96A2|nr:uncharacterized protein LOC119078426 [Bradysia coprophila]XP_037041831.1 uncharacterized protein LOC119078426 [Bradysia coprophila]
MAWITDGSDGFAINGDVVTYVDNEGVDNVFNAMWQDGDGVSSGEHYWKIHFPTLESGAGVGLTSKDYFKQGYACQAINYLGNLSNCSGLLVGSFGPKPKQGDTIGILAVFEGDRLKVYVDVNDARLGLAFNVPASTFKSIFPVVSFHSSGSATCTKQTEIPKVTSRASATFTGIEGDWKLTNLEEKNVVLDLPRTTTAKITMIEADKYSLHAKVVNLLRTTLTKTDGAWKACHITSTKKGGDPESMEEETAVKRLITEVQTVEVDSSGNLVVKTETMSSIWIRYDATPGPFIGEPFE